MKNILAASALALAGLFGAIPAAFADPIVINNTTYSLYIAGTQSGNAANFTATFDGVAEAFTRAGLDLTITESDTDMGNGVNTIMLTLRANGDLFPDAADSSQYALGIFGDGLDFSRTASLTAASIELFDLNGDSYGAIGLPVTADMAASWDGIYPMSGEVVELGTAGAPISGFTFAFTVSSQVVTPPPPVGVPEPGSVLLFAAGMAGVALWRRRTAA